MAIHVEQTAKIPEAFRYAHLLAKDFDNTVALSFETSPGGIGGHEAHERVVENMFGVKALAYYLNNNGLRNRAPIEVVQDLAPDAEGDELLQLTTKFIDTKLTLLLGEIGTRFPDGSIWPRPTRGYLELLEQIERARSEGRLIDNLILSSGHEPFIEKTYQAWGVRRPDHILAYETVRRLALDIPEEQLVKPSAVLMDIARDMWRSDYGIDQTTRPEPDEARRIVYVGDDLEKDGGLARNSGVDFVLLDTAHSLEIWHSIASRLQLGTTALRGAVQRGQ